MHSDPLIQAALPIAAILDDHSVDADALLDAVVRRLRAAGRRVRGLVMTYPDGRCECGTMVLVDVDNQARYRVSQPLGSGSVSCRVDPGGFAEASVVLRAALAEAPELVVSNRFGGLEASGEGLASELLELMGAGIPLLTIVSRRHLAAWTQFTGGAATLLPAREQAVLDWFHGLHQGAQAVAAG